MQSSTKESEVEDREATAQPLHKRIESEIMMNTFKGDNMTAPTWTVHSWHHFHDQIMYLFHDLAPQGDLGRIYKHSRPENG